MSAIMHLTINPKFNNGSYFWVGKRDGLKFTNFAQGVNSKKLDRFLLILQKVFIYKTTQIFEVYV